MKTLTTKQIHARLEKMEKAMETMMKNSTKHNQPISKIQFDATGQELDFYELDDDDAPEVGTKVSFESDKRASGEHLMPDGSTIKYKEGVVTAIIVNPKEDEMYTSKLVVEDRKSSTGQRIQIFNENPKMVFLKGNRIVIDGKKKMTGKAKLSRLEIMYQNGVISGFNVLKKPALRTSIFKDNSSKK